MVRKGEESERTSERFVDRCAGVPSTSSCVRDHQNVTVGICSSKLAAWRVEACCDRTGIQAGLFEGRALPQKIRDAKPL
jgi:hypothetical protein